MNWMTDSDHPWTPGEVGVPALTGKIDWSAGSTEQLIRQARRAAYGITDLEIERTELVERLRLSFLQQLLERAVSEDVD